MRWERLRVFLYLTLAVRKALGTLSSRRRALISHHSHHSYRRYTH